MPLFDRKGWKRVRFGDVVENVNDTESNPAEAGLDRFIGWEHLNRARYTPGMGHRGGQHQSYATLSPSTIALWQRPRLSAQGGYGGLADFDTVVSGDIYLLAPNNDRFIEAGFNEIEATLGTSRAARGRCDGSPSRSPIDR